MFRQPFLSFWSGIYRRGRSARLIAPVIVMGMLCVSSAHADTVTISGTLLQILPEGPLPAIAASGDGEGSDSIAYTMSLRFNSSFSNPGTYTLQTPVLTFAAGSAGGFQTALDSSSVKITRSGTDDIVSLSACSPVTSCAGGTRLNLNLLLPFDKINGQNVMPGLVPDLIPFDLLGGPAITDFMGSVATYSYVSSVPEPRMFGLPALGFLAVVWKRRRDQKRLAARTADCHAPARARG